MTEEPDNIILRQLRALDDKLDRVLAEVGELKTRMSAMEQHLIGIHLDIASLRERVGNLDSRMERLERRTGLIDA
jgi:regulator of replication initiation timing